MDLCLSFKMACFTLIIAVIGGVNILRGIRYNSKEVRLLIRPLAICVLRNAAVSFILYTLEGNFPNRICKNQSIEPLFVVLYIFCSRLLCDLRRDKFDRVRYGLWCACTISGFFFMHTFTVMLENSSVLYNFSFILPVCAITAIVLGAPMEDLVEVDSDYCSRVEMEDGPLKKKIVDSLERMYSRQYRIQSMNLLEGIDQCVHVVELDLNLYVVYDEKFMKSSSPLEMVYAGVHHVIEYYLGFRDTINILNMGSYMVLFLGYIFVMFGSGSEISVCLRFIICFELHEIAVQIKSVVLGYLAGYIERKITRKIGKNMPFTVPMERSTFCTLMEICDRHAVNRFLVTEYETAFYRYYTAERAQDINIKILYTDV